MNSVLQAAGLSPIDQAELDTPTQDDTRMAVSTVRNVLRELLSRGWRFNSEFGLEVAPAGTYTWVASDGTSTLLNIFKKPSGLLAWRQSQAWQNCDADLYERLSKRYTEASNPVNVLYDRTRNRDGLEKTRYAYVYLDVVYAMDFTALPEVARRYVTIVASRLFVKDTTGAEPGQSAAQNERTAWNELNKQEGMRERRNLLHTQGAWSFLGERPVKYGGFSRLVFRQ